MARRDKISANMEGLHLSADDRYATYNSPPVLLRLCFTEYGLQQKKNLNRLGPQSVLALGFVCLGWKTIRGAMVMPLMIQGYKKGLIKFTIITCRKPGAA